MDVLQQINESDHRQVNPSWKAALQEPQTLHHPTNQGAG